MITKEDIIREVEIIARDSGCDFETSREISAKLTLILRDVEISETCTDLVIAEQNEDVVMLKKFIMSKKIQGCTDRTIGYYESTIKSAILKFPKPLKQIDVDDIRWYAACREFNDGVTRTTVSNELRTLSSLFTFLVNEGYMQNGNPVMKMGVYKVQKYKKTAFTEIEIEKMRDALTTPKEKCIFEMLISTGCRVSELCQIKKKEIKGDEIIVHGKGQKDRIVAINAKAQVAIKNYLESQCPEAQASPWLFPKKEYLHTCLPAEHIYSGTIEAIIRKLGESLGIEAHPHKFRRTCATLALRRGMDLINVSRMLGHEQLTTTQIYLDLDDESFKQQHKKFMV